MGLAIPPSWRAPGEGWRSGGRLTSWAAVPTAAAPCPPTAGKAGRGATAPITAGSPPAGSASPPTGGPPRRSPWRLGAWSRPRPAGRRRRAGAPDHRRSDAGGRRPGPPRPLADLGDRGPHPPPRRQGRAAPPPPRDPVWWVHCAYCPAGASAIGERERAVVVLAGKQLRRVHPACLPYALAAGCRVHVKPVPVIV